MAAANSRKVLRERLERSDQASREKEFKSRRVLAAVGAVHHVGDRNSNCKGERNEMVVVTGFLPLRAPAILSPLFQLRNVQTSQMNRVVWGLC